MQENPPPNRCRVVLIAPGLDDEDAARRLDAALSGGDVASLIIPQSGTDEAAFQAHAERLTRIAQDKDVATIIAGEPRIAARVHADGIHFEGSQAELAEIIRKHQGRMVVGCGGAKNRDNALELGEMRPDYIFFGRFGYDTKPEPHPRNLSLAAWWSEMIEIPCIVLAGSSVESAVDAAATGAEFVALGNAVFAPGGDPTRAVAEINALLDQHAPAFDGAAP